MIPATGPPPPSAGGSGDQPSLPPGLLARLRRGGERLARENWRQRVARLEKLRRAIDESLPRILQALQSDLGKPPPESLATEIIALYAELAEARRKLKRWMRPRRVRNPLLYRASSSRLCWQPRGVVLIISPWNYPFQLAIGPLISALAAGNAVCLKPSELSPATSRVLEQLVQRAFTPDEVVVVPGAAETARELTRLPFDHVIFTGSARTGSAVMEAAAQNLTSVTLELGGKSPAIVIPGASLPQAAERIAWGKFLNAGQTCLAPDYVLVARGDEEHLLLELTAACQARWPSRSSMEPPGDYGRIIDSRHFDRLSSWLDEALSEGAGLVTGGGRSRDGLWLEPTVLRGVPEHCRILSEEIFGPILPVVAYDDLDQAIDFVRSRPSPLALYVFGRDRTRIEGLLQNVRAGGVVVNDVLVHFANPRLPFGGIGASGIGKLHGRFGFEACSHLHSILWQGPISPSRLLSPPYTRGVQRVIRWFLKLAG